MSESILTIDTTTVLCSAAIYQKKILAATVEHYAPRMHNQHLPAMVDYLLATTNTLPKELMGVAINKGPGSYTGLRIAASFAKGFCFSYQIPLLALNALHVLHEAVINYPFPVNTRCYALLDARRGNAYVLAHDTSERKKPMEEKTSIWQIDLLHQELPQDKNLFFIGNAADMHKDTLSQYGTIIPQCHPKASNMGNLAYQKLLYQEQEDLATFSPNYISAWA